MEVEAYAWRSSSCELLVCIWLLSRGGWCGICVKEGPEQNGRPTTRKEAQAEAGCWVAVVQTFVWWFGRADAGQKYNFPL